MRIDGAGTRTATAQLGVIALAALLLLAVPGGTDVAHARPGALSVTRFPGPAGVGREAWEIARGPGGMWFTETAGQRIGRISPTGAIQEFSNGLTAGEDCGVPQPPAPAGITSARGGVWFTDPGPDRIDRADASGAITEFYDAFACPHGLGLGGRSRPGRVERRGSARPMAPARSAALAGSILPDESPTTGPATVPRRACVPAWARFRAWRLTDAAASG